MGGSGRLKIWNWWGRDVVSLHDLDMVAAVTSRRELHRLTVRLRLPKPCRDSVRRVEPDSWLGDLALGRPGRLTWREPDDADQTGGGWRPEEDLEESRRGATARSISPGGDRTTPLHRP